MASVGGVEAVDGEGVIGPIRAAKIVMVGCAAPSVVTLSPCAWMREGAETRRACRQRTATVNAREEPQLPFATSTNW